jgi:hypothetical protein
MIISGHTIWWKKLILSSIGLLAILSLLGIVPEKLEASAIVVGHDINTLGTAVAGTQEANFAVNLANFLTSGKATRNLLLFESNPGDGTRNFATIVLNTLTNAGFALTVTPDYSTPFANFDAIFVAENYPDIGFINNTALITYVEAGGGVYLAGGVGPSPATEAAGWQTFLNNYGLAFATQYNGINNVAITSIHSIFTGITALRCGNGQSIIDLGTNPNAQIVQTQIGQGMYAVVNTPGPSPTPAPATIILLGSGLFGLVGFRRIIVGKLQSDQ